MIKQEATRQSRQTMLFQRQRRNAKILSCGPSWELILPPGFLAIRSFHLGGIRGRGGRTAPNPWVQHTVFYLGVWNQKPSTEKESCTDTRFMETVQGKKIHGFHVIPFWMQPFFTQQKLRDRRQWRDKEKWGGAFPGGPVVKNLPSNAGDEGLIPGGGTNILQATGQLSLQVTTTELVSHV